MTLAVLIRTACNSRMFKIVWAECLKSARDLRALLPMLPGISSRAGKCKKDQLSACGGETERRLGEARLSFDGAVNVFGLIGLLLSCDHMPDSILEL